LKGLAQHEQPDFRGCTVRVFFRQGHLFWGGSIDLGELLLRNGGLETGIRGFLQTRPTDTPFVDGSGSLWKGVGTTEKNT
jgi:hypothetical protein